MVVVLYCAQCHRQHCILHTFEQFEALYIYAQPRSQTSEFEAGTRNKQRLPSSVAVSIIEAELY